MGLANTATAGNATIVTNSLNANFEMHFNALSKELACLRVEFTLRFHPARWAKEGELAESETKTG